MYYKSETLATAFSFIRHDWTRRVSDPLHVTGSGDRWRRGRLFSEWSFAGQVSYIQQEEKEVQEEEKEEKKLKPGISVQFSPTVTLKTIYHTLKSQTEDIDLANEEEYPLRVTAFALKRKSQKDILKYQHQYQPLTPRRLSMQKHIRDTLQRENGNRSSSSSPPQTLLTNSTQTSS